MIGILIISLLPSLINCGNANCHLNESEVIQLQNYLNDSIFDNRKDFHDSYEYAICLGMTKCGKSTLINYLMGNELKLGRKTFVNMASIIKGKNNSTGPEIGTQSTSQTKDVSKWALTKIPKMYMWDTPGLSDNRGEVQDIKNAFSISGLVRSFKSVKFVFVLDYNHIVTDSTEPLINFLNYVQNLFGRKFINTFQSMAVIISKAPFQVSGINVDYEFINYHLEKFVSSKISMSLDSEMFINYTISHSNQVAFFRKIKSESEIKNIDFNIVNAINSCKFTMDNSFQDMQPSISHSTKNCLLDMRSKLRSLALISNLEKFLLEYVQQVTDKMNTLNKNATNENKGIESNSQLLTIRSIINRAMNPNLSFDEKISAIEKLDDRIKKKIKEINFKQNLNFMTFFDKCLGYIGQKDYELSFKAIVLKLSFHIDNQIKNEHNKLLLNYEIDHNQKMLEMDEVFSKEIALLQQELDIMQKEFKPANIFTEIVYMVIGLGTKKN